MHISDLRHENPSLKEKLEYLYSLRTGSKVNWDPAGYIRLLEALGNPHKSLPPILHVAGTNGKGSIIAMLRAIYEAAGYKVHAYTSPHLVQVNERIILGGEMISDEYLETLIDEALALIGDDKLSFFEIMTALAFKAFSQNSADILLLEVGMGGRLDCTNIIDKPLVSIISRISMDHTEFLGDTIEKIAEEKAGIIKAGTPFVIGYQGNNSIQALLQQKGDKHYSFGIAWNVSHDNSTMIFDFEEKKTAFPLPSLLGSHQIYNAGAALAAVSLAQNKLPVSNEHISMGLQNIKWRGRLERLPDINAHELWIDCGHNDSASEVLASQLELWEDKPVHLVLGMLKTKNDKDFITPLLQQINSLSIVPISHEPSSKTLESYKQALDGFTKVKTYQNVQQAIVEISKSNEPARILVTGSVYLAGEVLQHFSSFSCK